ncbi:Uncharacterised protein [uncultured archaeon]|nr:Uncharacterised protein [uncultured archaeon]
MGGTRSKGGASKGGKASQSQPELPEPVEPPKPGDEVHLTGYVLDVTPTGHLDYTTAEKTATVVEHPETGGPAIRRDDAVEVLRAAETAYARKQEAFGFYADDKHAVGRPMPEGEQEAPSKGGDQERSPSKGRSVSFATLPPEKWPFPPKDKGGEKNEKGGKKK